MKISPASAALVVGGASGIGEAAARRFAALGTAVGIIDLQANDARAVADQVAKDAGVRAVAVGADVTDYDATREAVEQIAAALGPPGMVVNTVGWNRHSFFMEQEPAFWAKVMAINYMGQVHVAHAVLPSMIEVGRGSIVTVASDAGKVGTMGETMYAGAKGGVISFTKSLAREVARYGVRVNCVSPGPTKTPLWDSATASQPHVADKMVKLIPLRRLGLPDEQAEALVFLASDSASFITGQTLSVNGGLNMV